MSKIKLVLTDIDGTLVTIGQHNPTLATQKSMQAVQSAGIELTAATGRPYEMTKDLFDELGFQGLCIFDGGATIRDVQTGELAWKNWLETDRLKTIVEILFPHCTLIDFFPTYLEVLPSETSLKSVVQPAPYVFAFVRLEAREQVVQQLQRIPGISYHIGPPRIDRPGVFDVQITDINSDKFHAVEALRNIVHSSKEETLAIGDSTNDIPLFQNAGLKIAMGNAVDELKAQADYIVGKVEEDGFAEAMNRFVLK